MPDDLMDSLFIVVARYGSDDVPVFAGPEEACREYADTIRESSDWEMVRTEAQRVFTIDIGTECIALAIVRVWPLPVQMVDICPGEEGE